MSRFGCFSLIGLFSFCTAAPAPGQETPIYYDYFENGTLKGGRVMIDRGNAEHRRVFGLDAAEAQRNLLWPVTTVRDNGPSANRVDVVLLGDGYTAAEQASYATHANNVITNFFAQEPFAAYATYFNVHRVDVTSAESGVDEIDLGIFRNTALDMAYGCFGIDRLLCISIFKAYQAAASAPEFEQILALANSTRYGGAGYPADDVGTLAGNNGAAVEIALHEFGHSFADLADEYDYGDGATYFGPEPVEPNVSIHDAATQIALATKWHLWMNLANVDAFEGAAYNQFGIYRPTFNSKMRALNRPFEQINVEQLVLSMYEIVSPIDDATPASPTPLSPLTTLYVLPLAPIDHSLTVQWAVDGVPTPGATGTSFRPADVALAPGLHDVSVSVTDTTTRVRDETARAALMTATRQWSVEVPVCEDVQAVLAEPSPIGKSRFISFVPANAGARTAIRVTLTELHHPDPPYTGGAAEDFTAFEGQFRWVGPPTVYSESSGTSQVFSAARLQCTPHFMDWGPVGLLHITGSEIVPSSLYEVRAVLEPCNPGLETHFSPGYFVATTRWADVDAPFAPPSKSAQPDVADFSALVNKFKSTDGAPIKARALLVGDAQGVINPVPDMDFQHISACVSAYKGFPYPYTMTSCP